MHAVGTTRKWVRRGGIAGAAALTLVAGVLVSQAGAATIALAPYDEENPNPFPVTEGLVFYKNADLGWIVETTIGDIESLDYTVSHSDSWAPSFQLITHSDQYGYARLVWEPYMQSGGLNANAGEYTDLQDGMWWTNKIASGPGSQANPRPLSFFDDAGGAGWTNVGVYAIDLHQGSTTVSTSVVTKVMYNGDSVALGNADATPFDQADLDEAVAAATSPLNAQIAGLQGDLADSLDQVSGLQDDLADAQDEITSLQADLSTKQGQLSAAQTQLANAQTALANAQTQVGTAQSTIAGLLDEVSSLLDEVSDLRDEVDGLEANLSQAQGQISDLMGQLTTAQSAVTAAQSALATAQSALVTSQSSLTATQAQLAAVQAGKAASDAALAAYRANHHNVDGTSIGTSRAVLSGTPVHGKTVGVKLSGTIAKATSVKYQWYLGGKAVSGATKSTYKVPSNARGKSVTVVVTGTSKYVVFGVQANTVTAK